MERFKNLSRYPKSILIITLIMALLFTVLYIITTSRIGFNYQDSILVPNEENGVISYSGTIKGQNAVITVPTDNSVIFKIGEKTYGPYIAKKDPSAVPKDITGLTGVEIRCEEEIFFRGGVTYSGDYFMLYNEDGELHGFTITAVMGDGTTVDSEGNVIDPLAPSASTILRLLNNPELTHKGSWLFWLIGVFVCGVTFVTILFADELFQWHLSFRVRDAYQAEPSDWELFGRHISWAAYPILALVIFIMGLK